MPSHDKNGFQEWGEEFIRKVDALLHETPDNNNIMRKIDDFFEQAKSNFSKIPVDIYETDDEWYVTADLPGVKKSQLDLRLHGNEITIKVRHQEDTKTEDKMQKYYYRERKVHHNQRTVRLPFSVNRKTASAQFNNGQLIIKGPKDKNSNYRLEIED
ncbi:HSP20 family protein [Gracilibacillus halotolerans]|uniref:HSP20 family protein n=1 Tax=Gracilibacillus halotolerans TaxID=74386 RepID=A0A841RMD1_9BACI|nr:Hsp20/alpha crystallin family protein [Gracilibacillus halotolerans]MBB6513037.1 HSP20 family protein [Gracilibacillus halotolerans]